MQSSIEVIKKLLTCTTSAEINNLVAVCLSEVGISPDARSYERVLDMVTAGHLRSFKPQGTLSERQMDATYSLERLLREAKHDGREAGVLRRDISAVLWGRRYPYLVPVLQAAIGLSRAVNDQE